MDKLKQFKEGLKNKFADAVKREDVFKANEITANIMVGSVMVIIAILMALCLVLNEIGVFTADIVSMRVATIICFAIEIPITAINSHYHGDKPWLKMILEIDLIIICALMAMSLGHNVTLVMVLPVILSVRYYEGRFTGMIAGVTAGVFLLAEFGNAFFGILNLNMYHVEAGTDITVVESLRQAVENLGIDRNAYFISLLQNDFLPRLLVFAVIAIACVRISKRGKMMIELQNDVARKSERVNTELSLATEIQAGMLPCIFPAFPDYDGINLFAMSRPAKEVGGDFYDFFQIDDDHIAGVIADVSGKGVGAALFMTISKIVIKTQLQLGLEPAEAMTIANNQLCENNSSGLFVTVWAAVYEISTGKLTYVNAGHNPPLLKRKGEESIYLTDRHGFVMAGMEGTKYSQSDLVMNEGDTLLLFTDGVTEATDVNNELYGEERLLRLIDSHPCSDAEEIVDGVIKDIDDFTGEAEQFDDITMLSMIINLKGEQHVQ